MKAGRAISGDISGRKLRIVELPIGPEAPKALQADYDRLLSEYQTWILGEIGLLPGVRDEDIAYFRSNAVNLNLDDTVQPIVGLVAYRGGMACGCAAIFARSPEVAELRRLFVRESERGRGVADRLLKRAIACASASKRHLLQLETFTFMQDALRLYRRAGFSLIAAPPNRTPARLRAFSRWFALPIC